MTPEDQLRASFAGRVTKAYKFEDGFNRLICLDDPTDAFAAHYNSSSKEDQADARIALGWYFSPP